MKKTLTVNLGGRVFHIDEDAYYLLDKYLTNLRIHFSKEEGTEEILEDFEGRISELFSEYTKLGYDVVTLSRVEEVINQMGKPEEIFGEEYLEEEDTKRSRPTHERFREPVIRRLFRNPDDKVLGGVASGLAAYLGWDPAWVRLGWILSIFGYGVGVPLYLVLWIILPKAQTATEKLQMRGESVTIESIGKTVTEGFERASNNFNEYITSEKPKSIFHKFVDFVVSVIGALAKFIFVCFSIIFMPIFLFLLFLFGIIFGSLMIGATSVLFSVMPNADWNYFLNFPSGALLTISCSMILVLGIPLGSGIYGIISYFFKFKPVANGVKWTLIVLWLLALLVAIYTGTFFHFTWWEAFN